MEAALQGCAEIVKLLLNMTDIDVNAKDDMNRSALLLAVDGLRFGLWDSSRDSSSSKALNLLQQRGHVFYNFTLSDLFPFFV